MDKYMKNDYSECSNEVTKEIVSNVRQTKICSVGQACNTTKFMFTLQEYHGLVDTNLTRIRVAYLDPEVEFHQTYINYNFQSLISEIGGVLGLTLGASVMSLVQSISNSMYNFVASRY